MAYSMKKPKHIFLFYIMFFFIWGHAQSMQAQGVPNDSLNKPKVNINVKKQFDSKGNLTEFDSSYSYSFPSGNLSSMNSDSILNQFRAFFNNNYSFPQFGFGNNFNQDSTNTANFFNMDNFMKQFQQNDSAFNQIYMQMDSLRGKFFQLSNPNGFPKE